MIGAQFTGTADRDCDSRVFTGTADRDSDSRVFTNVLTAQNNEADKLVFCFYLPLQIGFISTREAMYLHYV